MISISELNHRNRLYGFILKELIRKMNERRIHQGDSQRNRRSIKQAKLMKRKREREKIRRRRCYLLSFVFIFMMIFITGEAKQSEAATTVYIEVQNMELYQDSEFPEFKTKIYVEGNLDKMLEEGTMYSIESLITDLESGIGIELDCEVIDSHIEGEDIQDGIFLIDAHLTKEYQEKFENDWLGIVRVELIDGELDVVNKVGHWEESHFLSWEGELVTNQWVMTQGERYYLDENGEKLASTQTQIGVTQYTFDENGVVMASETYIDSDKPMVALTFDDGPSGYTVELLEVLEEYDSHATFFMQGTRITAESETTLQKMLEIGCEMGNHSATHANLTELSMEEIANEMDTTNDKIETLTGELPTVMRPPYGAVDAEVQAAVGLPIIQWNVDTMDWTTENSDEVLQHILQEVSDGDIILMHDTKSWSVQAAIDVIPILIEEGYQLVTVSEMAEAKGIELYDGQAYYFME